MEQNKVEAEKLLRRAAEHGYEKAQNDLGFAILNGDTSERDLVEAAKWCQLAVSKSTDPAFLKRARVNLSNALSQLTSRTAQLEADQQVSSFRALPDTAIDPLVDGWEKHPGYEQEDGRFGH